MSKYLYRPCPVCNKQFRSKSNYRKTCGGKCSRIYKDNKNEKYFKRDKYRINELQKKYREKDKQKLNEDARLKAQKKRMEKILNKVKKC